MTHFTINTETCANCLGKRNIVCHGPCPCPEDADQQPVHRHARENYCPLNLYPFGEPRPRGWELGEGAGAKTDHLTVAEILPLIDGKVGFFAPQTLKRDNIQTAYRLAMRSAFHHPPKSGYCEGPGIVICGGGSYFSSAYITISVLRHVGCNLPIELWRLPKEKLEDWQREALAPLGVIPRQPQPGEMRIEQGWPLKAWAVLHSAFAQIISFDADAYPKRDPTFLFNEPQIQEHGVAFWPDQRAFDLRAETWSVVGLPILKEPDVESGVMVFDKTRVFKPLALVNWMNQHSDYYYNVMPGGGGIHGDKTTFHLAFRFAGAPYAMPDKRWVQHRPAIVQHDFAGEPFVVHRVNGKLLLDATVAVKTNPDLPLESFVLERLEYLRSIAPPAAVHPPRPPRRPTPEEVTAALWGEFHRRPNLYFACGVVDVEAEQTYLKDLKKRLPCGQCQTDWDRRLVNRPPDFSSPLNYARWGWNTHNEISVSINKPAIEFEEAIVLHDWSLGCFLYKK